jgi:hypothetical protein
MGKRVPKFSGKITKFDGFFRGKIDNNKSIHAHISTIFHQLSLAIVEEGIVIAHENDRNL